MRRGINLHKNHYITVANPIYLRYQNAIYLLSQAIRWRLCVARQAGSRRLLGWRKARGGLYFQTYFAAVSIVIISNMCPWKMQRTLSSVVNFVDQPRKIYFTKKKKKFTKNLLIHRGLPPGQRKHRRVAITALQQNSRNRITEQDVWREVTQRSDEAHSWSDRRCSYFHGWLMLISTHRRENSL